MSIVKYGAREIEICAPSLLNEDTIYLDIDRDGWLEKSEDDVTPLEIFFANHGAGVVVASRSENETRWLRDVVVQRPDGTVLVPHCLKRNAIMEKVKELATFLFHDMNREWSFLSAPLEGGLFITYEGKVEEIHTSIDGGNVIFWKLNERNGAFVGLSAVFATLTALIQSKILKTERLVNIEDEKLAFGERMFLLGSHKQRRQFFEKNEEYRKEYEELWQLVFATMAKDLGIPEENLIILLHSALHIDLHALVNPNSVGQGKIYLHDPDKTIAKLKELQSVFEQNNDSFSEFEKEIQVQTHEMRLGIFEKNREILEEEGFIVEGIIGRLDTLLPHTGFFINGLMCTHRQDEHFFLTGPLTQMCFDDSKLTTNDSSLIGFSELHLLAKEMVTPLSRDGITVIFIDCFGAWGGGLHCLTNEYRKGAARQWPPQSIPVDSHYFPNTILTKIEVITNIEDLSIVIKDVIYEKEGITKKTINEIFSEIWGRTYTFIFGIDVPWHGLQYSWQEEIDPFAAQQKLYPGHHHKRKVLQHRS